MDRLLRPFYLEACTSQSIRMVESLEYCSPNAGYFRILLDVCIFGNNCEVLSNRLSDEEAIKRVAM